MKRKCDVFTCTDYFKGENLLEVNGDFYISKRAIVEDLIVDGDLIVECSLVAKNVYVTGDVIVNNSISVEQMHVIGDVYVDRNLKVDDLYVVGNVNANTISAHYGVVWIGGRLLVNFFKGGIQELAVANLL